MFFTMESGAESLTFREGQAPPDMDKQTITLKMMYHGCEKPEDINLALDGGKIKFDFKCIDGKQIIVNQGLSEEELKKKLGGDRPYRGNTGLVTVDYKSRKMNCVAKDIPIEVTYGLDYFYDKLAKTDSTCSGDKLAALSFKDSPVALGAGAYSKSGGLDNGSRGSKPGKKSSKQVHQYRDIGSQCRLPFKEVQLPGFGTEASKTSKIKMKDNEILIGDHTSYKWSPKQKKWIARWVKRDSKGKIQYVKRYEGGNLSLTTPIPVMFKRPNGKCDGCTNTHLAASVQLNPDGTANILSHKKVFKNPAAVFANLRSKNRFSKLVDNSAGSLKIDMNHVGNRKTVRQTKVSCLLYTSPSPRDS